MPLARLYTMPEAFGTYQILSTLGSGGMGTVYRARDKQRRTVALKVISPELLDDKVALWRFEREPKLHLSHPNIVQVYDSGSIDGYPYFAMQFIEGKSLSYLLAEQGRLTPEQLVPILKGVAAGLDAIHKGGIVHRDIKPSNILIDTRKKTLHPYLSDFGVAFLTQDHAIPTPAGVRAGTPRYMSPEQAKRQVATPQSDVYSLGVVAFEALTGRPPFDGAGDTRVLEMHQQLPPPSVRAFNPNIPINIANVIGRALAKDTQQRFRSAGEFALAYERAVSANPMQGQRTRAPIVLGLLATVLIVLLTIAAVVVLNLQRGSNGIDLNGILGMGGDATVEVSEADATSTALAMAGIVSDTATLSDTVMLDQTLEPTLEPTQTETPAPTERPTARATTPPTRTPTPTVPAPTATPIPPATATLLAP